MEPEPRPPSPSTTILAEAGLVHIRLETPDGSVDLWTRPENARRLALLLLAKSDEAEAQNASQAIRLSNRRSPGCG